MHKKKRDKELWKWKSTIFSGGIKTLAIITFENLWLWWMFSFICELHTKWCALELLVTYRIWTIFFVAFFYTNSHTCSINSFPQNYVIFFIFKFFWQQICIFFSFSFPPQHMYVSRYHNTTNFLFHTFSLYVQDFFLLLLFPTLESSGRE